MMDKIKHIFIVLVLPKNHCLSIKTHAVHNIHRLTWGPYARGAYRATTQRAHALKRHCLCVQHHLQTNVKKQCFSILTHLYLWLSNFIFYNLNYLLAGCVCPTQSSRVLHGSHFPPVTCYMYNK